MPKSLKGTETEKNLLIAFAGESQARNRYTYFASAARKRDMNRSRQYSLRLQRMKKNMPRSFLSILKAVMWRSLRHILQE
jgi:rubrerythrin